MKPDFLLRTELARRLYDESAAPARYIDYHTHLDPKRLASNEPFQDINELWLQCDPYKWRAMRLCGVPESLITGSGDAAAQFRAWGETLPMLAGNPLAIWSRMELHDFFSIDEPLTAASADRIRQQCNEQLKDERFRPRQLLQRLGARVVVTSDDWLEDLLPHQTASRQRDGLQVLPSLRADQALRFGEPEFPHWLERLRDRTKRAIRDLDDYLAALDECLNGFAAAGCQLADHGLDRLPPLPCEPEEAARLFQKVLDHQGAPDEWEQLQGYLLLELADRYAARGWVMQWHIGARRQTSSQLAARAHRPGGYACIDDPIGTQQLCAWLDRLERNPHGLPRSIIYPLNPHDYEGVATLTGSFVQEGVPGKIQLGPAWWYNDHYGGIRRHLEAVSAYSLLGHFIGMATDSRSFLSGVRHHYFRRILCDYLGELVERGELADDSDTLMDLVERLCSRNAIQTFQLNANASQQAA